MNLSSTLQTGNFESEYIPPLNLGREVLGIPWEQQLGAELAWQEATADAVRAKRGGPASIGEARIAATSPRTTTTPETFGRGSNMDSTPFQPSMQTITRMNTLLVALREQLQQVQTEAANIAIAEMNLRQGVVSEDAPPLPSLHEENARRFEELARVCSEIMTSAEISMAAITGRPRQTASERRKQSMVIDFPDRRMARAS